MQISSSRQRNMKVGHIWLAGPPLACLRVTVSSAMGSDVDGTKGDDPIRLMVCDVFRGYFHAPAIRPAYVKIVDEDFEPGDGNNCGKLNVSMYGARDAA